MSRRPYVRPMARTGWFLGQPRYRAYMMREATCLVVAAYCALVIAAMAALAGGDPTAWQTFLAGQQQPGWVVFHGAAFVYFCLYQSVPWFRLAPRAMAFVPGRDAAAARWVVAGHYVACLAFSAGVLWLAGVF